MVKLECFGRGGRASSERSFSAQVVSGFVIVVAIEVCLCFVAVSWIQ